MSSRSVRYAYACSTASSTRPPIGTGGRTSYTTEHQYPSSTGLPSFSFIAWRPGIACSWAGLTPRHRESDLKVHRGNITKQSSTLVRWAALEAANAVARSAGWLTANRRCGRRPARPQHRHRRNLLTLVYYGPPDGHIRALHQAQTV